ncbi:MAG: hypothetical protein HXX11_20135, partial [Desulfuromonadales bacterium]|nr:hypothetical protein [Desulfuromonadales bacterium]
IQNLGQALQSGDLSGAQQAFAKMQQGMKGAGKEHGHHHHRQTSGTAQDTNQTSQVNQSTYNNQGSIQDSGSSKISDSGTTLATTATVDILS